jgi:RNA polymerase sigma-70 factor (ECF subfamily)
VISIDEDMAADHPHAQVAIVWLMRETFEDAYVSGFVKVARFIYRKGVDWATAEDISQSAWTQAWRKRDNFRGTGSMTAWVTSIAFNILRSECRRIRELRIAELDPPIEGVDCSYRKIESAIDARTILTGCRPPARELLHAAYIEGLTMEEISVQTGTGNITTRVRLMRARREAAGKL